MALTADEKKALAVLRRAIEDMHKHYSSLDPATQFRERREAREACLKLTNQQNQLIQSAMDRDISFTKKELDDIKKIGDDIRAAAKKQQRVKNALKLFAKLAFK